MVLAAGVRIGWADLPAAVRDVVEVMLGGPVVAAVPQHGGFSPGTADRLRAASGGRGFVKAVSRQINAESLELLRREWWLTTTLPEGAGAPAVLGWYDDGAWAALLLEDVEGRQPRTPWEAADLNAVLLALRRLGELVPSPLADLPRAEAAFAEDFRGWHHLRAEPWTALDPWATTRLDELCALAERGTAATAGDALVHGDVRADNLLLRDGGSVVLVDWPWARIGARWLDMAALLVNVELFGGHDVDALAGEWLAGVPYEDVTGYLCGLAGFFLDHARRPAPPGLPTLRAFQLAQGERTLAWVRRRMG